MAFLSDRISLIILLWSTWCFHLQHSFSLDAVCFSHHYSNQLMWHQQPHHSWRHWHHTLSHSHIRCKQLLTCLHFLCSLLLCVCVIYVLICSIFICAFLEECQLTALKIHDYIRILLLKCFLCLYNYFRGSFIHQKVKIHECAQERKTLYLHKALENTPWAEQISMVNSASGIINFFNFMLDANLRCRNWVRLKRSW